ncbi:hypothetical protein [Roseateles sp.]|uniref:hypothetical protein n=1 Tax=Roseateles sp. TaxID=1971397 RepID=UPI00326765B5
MTRPSPLLVTALLSAALAVHAADMAPTASPQAKASGTPTAQAAAKPKPKHAMPVAGGGGGGAATDGSNTGTQVKPKLPKCPQDGAALCPKVKAVGQ